MAKKKIKVFFMIPTLTPGGAERVFTFVSQNLNPEKFSTELLVMGKSIQSSYVVDKIPVTYLNKSRVLHAIPKLFEILFKKKPDVVISSVGHLNMVSGVLAALLPSIRFIIRPTNIISNETSGWLVRNSFARVDSVICQSQDMADNFSRLYGTPAEKIMIIGNPITNIEEIRVSDHIIQTRKFITVGRLNSVKGHSRILTILSKLKKDFHYTIIGDGPEKEHLMTKIDELNLNSKITHIPYTDKINNYLVQNDLFLQGSYSEGFPNAVLESCTMGTPVLAFDVPGGTKEIIDQNVNGFLVNNNQEYLSVLYRNNHWQRSVVRNSVLSKFNPEKILEKYESLFLSLR